MKPHIEKYHILIALYIFGVIVSELMGAKTFHILDIGSFHLNASVAIFVLPMLYSLSDVVVEVKGRAHARGIVYLGIGVIVLLTLYAALATTLPPSTRFTPTEPAYDTIFHASIRISLASLAAFAVAESLDIAIFSKLRKLLHHRALWLRNNLSNFVGFFADSLVFLSLAFYAFDKSFSSNVGFIVGLLIPYWLLKCLMSMFGTPLVYAAVHWLKKPA